MLPLPTHGNSSHRTSLLSNARFVLASVPRRTSRAILRPAPTNNPTTGRLILRYISIPRAPALMTESARRPQARLDQILRARRADSQPQREIMQTELSNNQQPIVREEWGRLGMRCHSSAVGGGILPAGCEESRPPLSVPRNPQQNFNLSATGGLDVVVCAPQGHHTAVQSNRPGDGACTGAYYVYQRGINHATLKLPGSTLPGLLLGFTLRTGPEAQVARGDTLDIATARKSAREDGCVDVSVSWYLDLSARVPALG